MLLNFLTFLKFDRFFNGFLGCLIILLEKTQQSKHQLITTYECDLRHKQNL